MAAALEKKIAEKELFLGTKTKDQGRNLKLNLLAKNGKIFKTQAAALQKKQTGKDATGLKGLLEKTASAEKAAKGARAGLGMQEEAKGRKTGRAAVLANSADPSEGLKNGSASLLAKNHSEKSLLLQENP